MSFRDPPSTHESQDVMFFNGLGDAIAKVYGFMRREARILGPSPAYSTHSSAEAAHSGYNHVTYALDPETGWLPDLDDIRNKVRYNDSIAGILLLSPDNPTGAVYPREVIEEIAAIARANDIFIIADEIYANIVYNGQPPLHLSEWIGDVPGIAMRGISKEYRYPEHLDRRRRMFAARADEMMSAFEGCRHVTVNRPGGAFYFTVRFDDGLLDGSQTLPIENRQIRETVERLVAGVEPDKRFVYYLMGATGIVVVPLTGFQSTHHGFRATLLETDDEKRARVFRSLREVIDRYAES